MPKQEKKTLENDLKRKIKELSTLCEVGKTITSTLQTDKVLKLITRKTTKVMNCTSCSLRLLNTAKDNLVLKSSYGLNSHLYKVKKNLKVGESIAGRVVKEGKPYVISDLKKEKRYKYFYLAKQKGLSSLITVPLIQKGKTIGVLSAYNRNVCKYREEDVNLLCMLASQAAIAIENARLYEQAELGYMNTIKTLSNVIDAKDNYTYGHSERVMQHCMTIAGALNLNDEDKETLKYASLLHDIGKIGIDIGLLRKPSRLSNEEWRVIFMHPVLGSNIVEQVGFLSDLAPIILHHHERYDGKGYPAKIKVEKIPMGARILSIADAYESMVSDRPYRKALSFNKARQELLELSGVQFDPKIVKVFLKVLDKKKKR